MLNITELDDLICQQLNRHDLAQCARVSKQWHSIVIPHLWCDLSHIDYRKSHQSQAIRRVVLDDYLGVQQQQSQLDPPQDDDHLRKKLPVQASSSPLLPAAGVSALARYGPWIRELPYPNDLLECLKPPTSSHEPTEHHLLRHLYRLYPTVVSFLRITGNRLTSDDYLETISFIIPNTRHLSILLYEPDAEPRRLKNVLRRCSSMLESLSLHMSVADNSNDKEEEEGTRKWDEPKSWTSLKALTLLDVDDKSDLQIFWPWLWERCHHVEKLVVVLIGNITDSLIKGMWVHMPHLSKIYLGQKSSIDQQLTDHQIARILSASRSGWKIVEIRPTATFGSAANTSLTEHFTTLQVLRVHGSRSFPHIDIVRILASCPQLQTLAIVDGHRYARDPLLRIRAQEFVDMNPSTSLLNPWACESSLKDLSIRITGIPRPDLEGNAFQEAYPGEGRMIQGQVYDRLARLTNLNLLTLGSSTNVSDRGKAVVQKDQCDCLDMSLESGLHRLAGLRQMKELYIPYMKTRIGLKEGQWMVEQWPQLRLLNISERSTDVEVVRWLHDNHPRVEAYFN
ncbi:hypothetical protein B0O80DRAFT_503120 [Mortierella sp. GBAus27b]|nr:hypothetical protein BGX31_000212 [Mortierella sp. GBA43]KAI8346794.1 hypothetical protein B0O80DRAFT_503120 [Mortierella sp. GBAus27b]